MADAPRYDPLHDARMERLPLMLKGERCIVTFADAGHLPLQIKISRVGMDYVSGKATINDKRYVIPLSAIAFVELV